MSNQEQKPSFPKTQTITYPNGTQELYTFNENKELIQLNTAEQTYSYQRAPQGYFCRLCSGHALGRITQLNKKIYTYDALGRLTRAGITLFEYAPQGHFFASSGHKAGNNLHKQSSYDTSMNQLLEDAQYKYTYDANGNLKRKIDKQTQEMLFYRYNDLNQLVEHYKADETDHYVYRLLYTYDGFNRRITKTYIDSKDETKSFSHQYLYDGENIIAILDLNNNKQLFILKDGRLYMMEILVK